MQAVYRILMLAVLCLGLASSYPQRVNWNEFFAPTPAPAFGQQPQQQQGFFPQTNSQNPFLFPNNNQNLNNFNNFNTNAGELAGVVSTTTAAPATATTASPQFLACMASCPSTMEYNPVCGSDDISYHNNGRLQCARSCGKDVMLLRGGTCRPL